MKFIIAARPYNHQSFGVVTLHKLYENLRKLDFEVEIIFFEGNGKDCKWGFSRNPTFYRPGLKISPEIDYKIFFEDVCREGIIVYPEIIYDNPLRGKNVVRYLLNKEKALKPWGMNSSTTDFHLTHSKIYRENFDFLLFNPPDIDWVHDIKINDFEKRSIDISYLGKGVKYGYEKIVQGTFEITREWPKSQSQLRLLLNNSRYFFCFDSISSTQLDAILCGSVPFIFEGGPITFDHIKNNAEIPFYTGIAEINEDMEIKNISFDLVEFNTTREKIICTVNKILESYEDQVFSLTKKIKSHFNL